MSDSLVLDEVEKDTPCLAFTDRMSSLSLSEVDSGLPAHPDISSLRYGHPHRSLFEPVLADDGLFRQLFDVSSPDEASCDGGRQTSFQGLDPLWRFCEEESDGDKSFKPVRCSDVETDSALNEPKGAQMSSLSTDDEDAAISELATKVLHYARTARIGVETEVTEQCVAVMSKVRRIPREGHLCPCDYCHMEPPWREGPVAKMNGSCGAYAWGSSCGLVVSPGQTTPLIERTWRSVSDMVDKWGKLTGSSLKVQDYRTINNFEGGMSFSPVEAAEHTHAGMIAMAVGCEGMLNGAGMFEHYPATGDYRPEILIHDSRHNWIDCSTVPSRRVERSAPKSYACVSHTWGRYCCQGTKSCKGTGEYQYKHVCQWSKDEGLYWDERDIEAAVVAAGWRGLLWLDWIDIPVTGLDKVKKIKAQAQLYAQADRVYVFVPATEFISITEAIKLSEAIDTCGDFVKLIRQLSDINWFTSTWTLQEMYFSYKRIAVVTHHGKVIHQGWLEQLRDRLVALVDCYEAHLESDDLTRLMALGVLHLGDEAPRMIVTAIMRSGGITHGCYDREDQARCSKTTHYGCDGAMCILRVFDSIRYGLIEDVPNGLAACAQLVSWAVQQHDTSWLAFKAVPSERRTVPVHTLPIYGATWPAAGKWQNVCDLLATGAGLLWFGMTGMVTLQPDQYWLDSDVGTQGLFNAESKARVIVICVRAAGVPTSERWLGLIVSGDSGRARRLGGCNLQTSQIEDFKSGAVLLG